MGVRDLIKLDVLLNNKKFGRKKIATEIKWLKKKQKNLMKIQAALFEKACSSKVYQKYS